MAEDNDVTESLKDEDFSEDISEEDVDTIKKVANDDNFSQAKSYCEENYRTIELLRFACLYVTFSSKLIYWSVN